MNVRQEVILHLIITLIFHHPVAEIIFNVSHKYNVGELLASMLVVW